MSIVSSYWEWEGYTQSNNHRTVANHMTDHNAVEYIERYYHDVTSPDSARDAILVERVAAREQALDDEEVGLAVHSVFEDEQSPGDALALVQNPDHSTSKKIAKALIYYMMRHRAHFCVFLMIVKLEGLLVYLNANYTDQQLRNFLDITQTQLEKMRRRVKYVLDLQDPPITPKEAITLVDDDTEDWDD